jgi:hypothetical protein
MIVSSIGTGKNPFSIHGCHNTSADLHQPVAEIRRKKSVLPLRKGQNCSNFLTFVKNQEKAAK